MLFRILQSWDVSYTRKFEHIISSNWSTGYSQKMNDRKVANDLGLNNKDWPSPECLETPHSKKLCIPIRLQACLCNHSILHTFTLLRISGSSYAFYAWPLRSDRKSLILCYGMNPIFLKNRVFKQIFIGILWPSSACTLHVWNIYFIW
jgi:hypothetical protein